MIVKALKSNNKMTYEEALLYCQFLDYHGHSDWRMPTHSEWIINDMAWCWFGGRGTIGVFHTYYVLPVRDV